MKLHILSDLHIDCHRFDAMAHDGRRHDEQADVVILAGDIDTGSKTIRWARETFASKEIVFVCGNHEFYGNHWDRLLPDMREMAAKMGVHFLENDAIEIGGFRFLGATLWTDFELYGSDLKAQAIQCAKSSMNDYQRIKIAKSREYYWVQDQKLFPQLTSRRHRQSFQWLTEQLSQSDPDKTIVVTHHAPHERSIPDRYKGELLSAAFGSDMSSLMGKSRLWVHGHVHDSNDYCLGGTRIVCNPRGYLLRNGAFENAHFDPGFTVEV
jgi:Icc-related predicted phosphoesterase